MNIVDNYVRIFIYLIFLIHGGSSLHFSQYLMLDYLQEYMIHISTEFIKIQQNGYLQKLC